MSVLKSCPNVFIHLFAEVNAVVGKKKTVNWMTGTSLFAQSINKKFKHAQYLSMTCMNLTGRHHMLQRVFSAWRWCEVVAGGGGSMCGCVCECVEVGV